MRKDEMRASHENTSVKRRLRIADTYTITEVFGPTAPELKMQRIKVLCQFPDAHLPHNVLAIEGIMMSGQHTGERFYVQAHLQHVVPVGVCNCKAYEWPHRPGGGSCFVNAEGPFCGDCERPTTAKKYTYKFNRVEWLSECCEAPLFQDFKLEESYQWRPSE